MSFSEIPFVVEGRYLAMPEDAEFVEYKPIARFKHEAHARMFMRALSKDNAESSNIDRIDFRLKHVNKILPIVKV